MREPKATKRRLGIFSAAREKAFRAISQPFQGVVVYYVPTVGTNCLPRGCRSRLGVVKLFGVHGGRDERYRQIGVFIPSYAASHKATAILCICSLPSCLLHLTFWYAVKSLVVLEKIYFRSFARREFCHPLGSFPPSSHDNIGIRYVFVGNGTVGLENSAFDIHLVKVRLFFLWSGLPTPTSKQRSQLLDQSCSVAGA